MRAFRCMALFLPDIFLELSLLPYGSALQFRLMSRSLRHSFGCAHFARDIVSTTDTTSAKLSRHELVIPFVHCFFALGVHARGEGVVAVIFRPPPNVGRSSLNAFAAPRTLVRLARFFYSFVAPRVPGHSVLSVGKEIIDHLGRVVKGKLTVRNSRFERFTPPPAIGVEGEVRSRLLGSWNGTFDPKTTVVLAQPRHSPQPRAPPPPFALGKTP